MLVYATSPGSVPSTDDLRALLPPGSIIEPVASTDGTIVLPGRLLSVDLRATNLEGLGRGTLQLIEGRLPATPEEIALSADMVQIAGSGIGQRVELAGWGSMEVVGLVEDPGRLSHRLVLLAPALADQGALGPASYWLVALPADDPAPDLAPHFDANPRQFYRWSSDQTPGVVVVGAMTLIETVLIGAAAFAVSIRRRQRELGLLAAAGASRRQLAGTVLGEGMVLAGLAAAVGVVAGIAVVAFAAPWMDQLTDRRNPPLVVDLVAVGLAAAAGVVAGIAAAAVPAWTAARLPALVALSGRRPPESSARRTLILGLALIGVSLALTALGASLLLADPASGIAPLMLVAGAMVGVLGFGACSPWLVERLEWIGRRLPIGARIALRDSARARSRTAPIVTATLAGLAAAIAIASLATYSSSSFYRGWTPSFRQDQLLLTARPYELPRLAEAVSKELRAVAFAPIPDVAYSLDGSERYLRVLITQQGDAPALDPVDGCPDCLGFEVSVGSPELLTAIGVPAELSVVPPDSVLLLLEEPFDARIATLAIFEPTGEVETPDGEFMNTFGYTHSEPVNARAVAVGAAAGQVRRFPSAYVAPETAARLGFGLSAFNSGYVIRLDRPVTEADVALAAGMAGEAGHVEAAFPPTDPNAMTRLLAVLLSVILALTVTAIAVALGEGEARADQRTLLAIGADPGLRRWIVAARAGVLAVLAALLAVPAGLLPVWGLLASRDEPLTVPLPELALMVGVMPIVAIAGALLLSRPIPQWSAFRDVAHE
jgi:putative ABC transport system permease protein